MSVLHAGKLIYVASSWKNANALDPVHAALKAQGLRTWDFRDNGFWWRHVSSRYLGHPFAFPHAPESRAAFDFDRRGLDICDGVFVVQPAGVATALEAGYAAGQRKPVVVWGTAREERLDIMWNFAAELLPAEDYDLTSAALRMLLAFDGQNRGAAGDPRVPAAAAAPAPAGARGRK